MTDAIRPLIAGNWKMNGLKAAFSEFEAMLAGSSAVSAKADLLVYGNGERQIGARGAGRDAAGLDHVAEQAEIGEIETHGGCLRGSRKQLTPNTDCGRGCGVAYTHCAKLKRAGPSFGGARIAAGADIV